MYFSENKLKKYSGFPTAKGFKPTFNIVAPHLVTTYDESKCEYMSITCSKNLGKKLPVFKLSSKVRVKIF